VTVRPDVPKPNRRRPTRGVLLAGVLAALGPVVGLIAGSGLPAEMSAAAAPLPDAVRLLDISASWDASLPWSGSVPESQGQHGAASIFSVRRALARQADVFGRCAGA